MISPIFVVTATVPLARADPWGQFGEIITKQGCLFHQGYWYPHEMDDFRGDRAGNEAAQRANPKGVHHNPARPWLHRLLISEILPLVIYGRASVVSRQTNGLAKSIPRLFRARYHLRPLRVHHTDGPTSGADSRGK